MHAHFVARSVDPVRDASVKNLMHCNFAYRKLWRKKIELQSGRRGRCRGVETRKVQLTASRTGFKEPVQGPQGNVTGTISPPNRCIQLCQSILRNAIRTQTAGCIHFGHSYFDHHR